MLERSDCDYIITVEPMNRDETPEWAQRSHSSQPKQLTEGLHKPAYPFRYADGPGSACFQSQLAAGGRAKG